MASSLGRISVLKAFFVCAVTTAAVAAEPTGATIKKVSAKAIKYETDESKEADKVPIWFMDRATGQIRSITKKQIKQKFGLKKDDDIAGVSYSPVVIYCHPRGTNLTYLSHLGADGKVAWKKVLGYRRYPRHKNVIGYTNNHISLFYVDARYAKHVEVISVKDMKSKDYVVDSAMQVWTGVVLEKRNKFVYWEEPSIGDKKAGRLLVVDLKTKTKETIFDLERANGYRNEVCAVDTDPENRYLVFSVNRATRGPSRWVGLCVYDFEKKKIILRERFGEQNDERDNHQLKDPKVQVLKTKEIAFTYTDVTEQKVHFVKYSIGD